MTHVQLIFNLTSPIGNNLQDSIFLYWEQITLTPFQNLVFIKNGEKNIITREKLKYQWREITEAQLYISWLSDERWLFTFFCRGQYSSKLVKLTLNRQWTTRCTTGSKYEHKFEFNKRLNLTRCKFDRLKNSAVRCSENYLLKWRLDSFKE